MLPPERAADPERIQRILLLAFAVALLLGVALVLGYGIHRYQERAARAAAARLTVTVINVGHGEAAWVRTPDNHFILIGGGPPGAGIKVVEALRNAGAQRIDLMILPYPYAEAIGGIPDVLAAFPVAEVIEPGGPRVNQGQQTVRQWLADHQVPVSVVQSGDRFPISGARVDVLAPAAPFLTAQPTAANNSLVVRIGWNETGFLFAGGIERAGEDALIARSGEALRSDWLRVARFGTGQASAPEFLRLVSPQFAVVSVGEPNSGGYPDPDALQRLQATGARVYRTDLLHGQDLTFTSDGETVTGPS
jgi:beta-lactamase superfamily II metal-dependent hydrolase